MTSRPAPRMCLFCKAAHANKKVMAFPKQRQAMSVTSEYQQQQRRFASPTIQSASLRQNCIDKCTIMPL